MSKSALGRGLGSLLPVRNAAATTQTAPSVTPGVARLLRGQNGTNAPATPDEARVGILDRNSWLRGLLWGADLLLCLLAVLFATRSSQPLRADEIALCLAAVTVGAGLACAASQAAD